MCRRSSVKLPVPDIMEIVSSIVCCEIGTGGQAHSHSEANW
jgi:hypothetical protein